MSKVSCVAVGSLEASGDWNSSLKQVDMRTPICYIRDASIMRAFKLRGIKYLGEVKVRRKLGLLLIICFIIALSGCQQKTNTGSQEDQPTPTPEVTATAEPTNIPQSTVTPIPSPVVTTEPTATATPTPVATPKPTETPEPEVTKEPVVAPEDITYRLDTIIPVGPYLLTEDTTSEYCDCYITENGFYIVYYVQEGRLSENGNTYIENTGELRLDHYDVNGQLINTTYQPETEPLPDSLSQDEYYWLYRDVLKKSSSGQNDIPVMGMMESDLNSFDTYHMNFIGPVGTDGMLFSTWARHTSKDIRLFKKVPAEEVSYACTLGVISDGDDGWDSDLYLAARYNRIHPDNRVKVINYMEDGETYEQAFEKLRTDLRNGKGPDILSLDKEHLEILYQENLLTDLGKQAEINVEDIFPGVHEYFSQDGEMYAIPTHIGVWGVILPKECKAELTGNSFREIREWAEQKNVPIFNGYGEPYELLTLMIKLDKDEYIYQDMDTLSKEIKSNLEYISKYDFSYENSRMISVESISNLLGHFNELFLDDENMDVTGFSETAGGNLQIYRSTLALQKNVANREVAYSFLNWYLSGEDHVTDNLDSENIFLAPTASGCRKQQVFLANSGWFDYETISAEATERLIEFLKQSKMPAQDYEAMEDIIFEEGMDYLSGNITIEQAMENMRTRLQELP